MTDEIESVEDMTDEQCEQLWESRCKENPIYIDSPVGMRVMKWLGTQTVPEKEEKESKPGDAWTASKPMDPLYYESPISGERLDSTQRAKELKKHDCVIQDPRQHRESSQRRAEQRFEQERDAGREDRNR